MCTHKSKILVDVVRRTKPKRVLEIGAFIVSSVSLMGKELETDADVITIEIDPNKATAAEATIRKEKIQPAMETLVGDALRFLRS